MAATIQTPAQQPPPTSNNTSPANPQLKRIVYSKYRELLGSYNDKANAIIESLPAYMVKEDRGFHFDPKIIDEVDKVVYGTPPAPPPLSTGSVPSQRLSTQMPQYNVGEAPACVQNAMMTKDKKPFTYTPGGIDLSQIKSQRMAKRLARNAQSEGATGQQQANRPTPPPQQQSNGGTPPAAAAQLGATAMGMPFQVFPTGPPPPPPPQPNKGGAPPPPPPAPQNKLGPQSNGNAAHARKSPTPQNFEPPPMGFRPEIKIPPNPMAALKKVPPPQEKNNFWVEEYRKERSKSPMVGNDENDYNRSSPNNPQPETNQYTYNNNNNQQNDYQSQQNQYRRSPSPQPMRQQQEYYSQRAASPPRTPAQQLDQQRRNESPYQTQQYSPQPQPQQQQQQYQLPSIQRQTSHQYESLYQPPQPSSPQQQQPSPPIQRQQTAPPQQYQGPTSPQYQPQQQSPPTPQQQQQQQQSVPWRSQRPVATGIQNNVSRPRDVMSPAPSESPRPQPQPQQQQQQQQYPPYLRSREVLSPAPEPAQMSQPYQQKNSQVGSIYIPPVAGQNQQQSPPYQDPQSVRQQQSSRQVPANRWVSPPQPSQAEAQPLNRIKSPPPPSSNGFGSSNNTGLRLQINNNTANAKERIIPIQLEHTPTPTRTPSAPGFGPQPFYNANQQYSSVPSPPLAQGPTSNGQNSPSYIVRSPNQFVDQGYNNYPGSQDPNRVTSPTAQQMQSPRIVQQANTAGGVKTRIIPIAFEAQPDGPLNPNNVRGPISQQPLVIQNDPRNQNAWGSGNTTPNQSKSFRVLQKITDTTDDGASEGKTIESDSIEQEPQLQRPTFARQMGPGQVNSPTIEQMKRMQLNNEQAFANRAKNQDDDKDKEATVKAAVEDPRYRGPSNPSITFKKLQGAIEQCPPSTTANDDGFSPVMKQPQPNRYANQRPVYSPEEQPQQYVHPSEQQVPEPKKYTGSAIPSRSFKILQAMTTPENAAEMEDSDVVESNKSITESPYPQPHPAPFVYHYPYLPPCCPPPPPTSVPSSGDVHNWQYPLPPHHHPMQHHHHHHHPHHQHHPQHPYPPCPYYYYYAPNEYDSQNCSQFQAHDSFSRGNSQSQDLPNIIITPSAEDIPQVVKGTPLVREQREGSVIETLSRRLSEIAQPPPPVQIDLNMSQQDDKTYVGDGGKEFDNSPSPIKSECENNKVSSEDSSDDLLTSSTDPTTTSSFEDCAEQVNNDGLQAIKSVTNIQVYNKKKNLSTIDMFDDDRTVADGESMTFDDEDEDEDEIIGEDLEYDEEEVLIEEMDSEDEGGIEELEELEEDEEDEVIIMDDLSVIYEENEADAVSPRPASHISSSVSDSTTLANEEFDEEEEEVIKEEDEDDNSNSVTVRLPLKFSFSRSSNDESIATVEVGSSQIEDKRRSFSIASVQADPEEEESDSQDCDVSVTISLSPSSGSFDRKSSLSPVPRSFGPIVKENLKEEDVYDSEAEDVSVSFSLPMRNKFMDQTWSGDVTNNIAKKKTKKKKTHCGEHTAVETWMKNGEAFEEKDVLNCPTVVMDVPVETRRRNSAVFEDRDDKTVVLKTHDVAQALADTETRDIRKIMVMEDTSAQKTNEQESQSEKQPEESVSEELDFWATLQATRKEAQLFLEKTADYWGKKINGTEKDSPKSEAAPTEEEKPKDAQTEEEFWASIRVQDKTEKPEAVEAPADNQEESKVKKEAKLKSTKPKKKKKIIKAPEEKPEPEHVWSTIKLSNANNRAKIVESTIQMIQSKTKKELVKSHSKEVEVSDLVATIKETYDKEEKEAPKPEEVSSVSMAKANADKKPSKEPKIEDISINVSVSNEPTENVRNNLTKEKAELKTQIMNQKFANAFVIPDKPLLMKATLSEWKIESTILTQPETVETSKVGQKWEFSANVSSPISYETDVQKMATSGVEIVIEESEKLEKPKKKVLKGKKVVEEPEGDTLKLPKVKTVKKSTKDTKKIKKKKLDTTDLKIEEISSVSLAEEDETSKTEAESVTPDFWADIESSKNSQVEEGITVSKVNEETDFWATIQSSTCEKEEKCESRPKKTDYWFEVESPKEEEPDFWAEIESSKDKCEGKVELQTEEIDIWADIEASKAKPFVNYQEPGVESVEEFSMAKKDDVTEVQLEEINIWAETEAKPQPKNCEMENQETDFWAEVESSRARNINKPSTEDEKPAFWNYVECPKPAASEYHQDHEKWLPIKHQEPNYWSEVDSSKDFKENKAETTITLVLDTESSKTKLQESDDSKPKKKKKSKKIILDSDCTPEAEPLKPKTKAKKPALKESEKAELPNNDLEAEKPKTKKKTSPLKADTAEIDFWAEIETSKPITSKKTIKSSSLHVYRDCDIELINLEPVPTYHAINTQPELEVDFWATISYADEDTLPESKVFQEKETDFWASNSSGNETEVNSEVDTGKIDFWVTQRKFETNRNFVREATPTKQEEPEEVDFWAEIKKSTDADDDVQVILPKDECETRRNNYKKAMAFFTNTVNVEKKEESPAPVKNIETTPTCEKEKTPEAKPYESWVWRKSTEHDWEAPDDREVNDVFLIMEDNDAEEESNTLRENNAYEVEDGYDFVPIEDEQAEEEESSESISDSTPNHFQIEHQYPKPEPAPIKPKEKSVEPISSNKFNEEIKISVKDRIFAFETGAVEPPAAKPKTSLIVDSATPKSNLSRNSSQRSESEIEEDDSGVTDMNKLLSETDTESESFPELRKMTRYQRASTHSRLFKLLQDDGDIIEEESLNDDKNLEMEFNFKPRKKIVHNVSITRKQNPKALQEVETLIQRRERLSLPLHKNSSIDADNLSSPNSPASPIFGQPSQAVSDKLVNELVQSLLLKKSSSTLKNLPMEKLQAAAKRVLEEELDSLENTSLDSTPALTPQEFKSESYSDYYDSWSAKTEASDNSTNGSFEILPSKAFKALQDTTATSKRRPWAVRCPRVLSSKTVNRDLARVTESPEIFSRSSNSPEIMFGTERASSVGRWRKV